MEISYLQRQHDELRDLAAELLNAVMTDKPKPVAALRWRMARILMEHLALEDRWLYPSLIEHGPPRTVELAKRLRMEIGDLATAFTAYMSGWTEQRIGEAWPEFRKETLDIIQAIQMRMRYENEQFYPFISEFKALSGKALSD